MRDKKHHHFSFSAGGQYLCAAGAVIFLCIFLVLPVLVVISSGLEWRNLLEAVSNHVYQEGLLNSFAVAAVTVLFTSLIAVPLALVFDRYEFPGKNLCSVAMLIPMILPPFVGAMGFQQILGHYGVINMLLAKCGLAPVDFLGGRGKFYSVCLIEALHLYPVLYLNLINALGNIDPAYRDAGRNLGGGAFYRFRRITLPLLKPGLFAGGSLVLIWSFTELGTPLMFGYTRVTPVQIFNNLTELTTSPVTFSLVALMLVFSSLLYYFGKVVLGHGAAESGSGGSGVKGGTGTNGNTPASWRRFLPPLLFAAVTLLASLPHLALIFTAFFRDWYGRVIPCGFTLANFENALSHQIVVPSIINSLKYSLSATLISLLLGVLVSMCVIRWKLKGSALLDLLAMLPLSVPGIVIAFGFLGMSVKFTWAHELFNIDADPLFLLAIAYAVRRLPYVVRSVSAGLEQISAELEKAARNLGAGAVRVFSKVTLPLIWTNIAAGALFAFSFSMLEVSDSLILAQKAKYFPITKAIFELSQILGSGPFTGCAFGVWAMLFLGATLLAAGILLGKKFGSVFRL